MRSLQELCNFFNFFRIKGRQVDHHAVQLGRDGVAIQVGNAGPLSHHVEPRAVTPRVLGIPVGPDQCAAPTKATFGVADDASDVDARRPGVKRRDSASAGKWMTWLIGWPWSSNALMTVSRSIWAAS